MDYLFQGKLGNKVHDISYEQIKEMLFDNASEMAESYGVTQSSYKGDDSYKSGTNFLLSFFNECLYRDAKTDGIRIYYPHGVVIEQAKNRNYYRGENQIYKESVPTLLRSLEKYNITKEKELYRLVADMRIAEFDYIIHKFEHVKNWKYGDVLTDTLAQHYGLETSWLDITSDLCVALFFATCYFEDGKWKPLTIKQTEVDENHKYGIIYHMPSHCMASRWSMNSSKFEINETTCPKYQGEIDSLIYPIGFQPFMRCYMQNGYGIYMRTPKPLQGDIGFEKLRFRHSEKLSKDIFELMRGGECIYPYEGLNKIDFLIDDIRSATSFSKEAFETALYRNHYFKLKDADAVKEELGKFMVDGKCIEICDKHPFKLSSLKRKTIDKNYHDFSLEKLGVRVLERTKIPGPKSLYEPWMIPELNDGDGIKDFKPRKRVDCGCSIADYSYIREFCTLLCRNEPNF